MEDLTILTLAIENAELRAQLAVAQEQCVELAVDAGELHAELEALRQEVSELRAERDRKRLRVA
jgi:chromosome segregation ATPase